MNKKRHPTQSLEKAHRKRPPSTKTREEIRGKSGSKGEASPSAKARRKAEVTQREMLPCNEWK